MRSRDQRSKARTDFVSGTSAKRMIFKQSGRFHNLTNDPVGGELTGDLKIIAPDFREISFVIATTR